MFFVSVGASVDPAGVTMLDSIKIYGKTKEQFGWPDEPPEDFPSACSQQRVQPQPKPEQWHRREWHHQPHHNKWHCTGEVYLSPKPGWLWFQPINMISCIENVFCLFSFLLIHCI